MPKIKTNIDKPKCPKCNSEVYCYGLHPEFKLQRFRCKNSSCKYQFVPNRPQRNKTSPNIKCPKCGSNMSIFKRLSDGLRLRCNRYHYKDSRKCNHKINIPFPGKQFNIANDPIDNIPFNLPIPFCWPKMKFSKATVSLALYYSIFQSIPATQVSQTFNDIFNLSISHDTITRWSHKAILCIHHNLGPLSVPYSNHKKLFTDETRFKLRGNKRWVWLAKDSKFDSIQSWFISHRRSTEFARNTFNIAFYNSPSLRKAKIVTDGLWSYPSALADLNIDVNKYHLRYIGLFDTSTSNNNRLERFHSTLKSKARPFRGFKSDLGLWVFISAQIYLHNFFIPHKRLNGITPAELVGRKLPPFKSKWKLFMHFL